MDPHRAREARAVISDIGAILAGSFAILGTLVLVILAIMMVRKDWKDEDK